MTALNESRREALERLTAALSEALALRRRIDDELLNTTKCGDCRDYMRQLRYLCKSEMLNLKSYCGLFVGTKTFIGFHRQFDTLLRYSRKMLADQGRL